MSIQRYSNPSTAPSVLIPFIKVPLMLTALLVVLVCSLALPNTAIAAEVSALGLNNNDDSGEVVRESIPDSFGRDTPRQTVQGFISALGENDYLLASNYLNLSKSDNPTTAVRQFKQALDAGGRFQPDLQISNAPEGNLTDQLPPSQENVGRIKVGDTSIPLILERVVSQQGEQYWQFSSETLSLVPEVIENTEPTLVSRYSIDSLEGKKLFGYQLADLAAAIIMIVGVFVLTYIVVWLAYHLLRIAYPRVRGVPLPLPNKVILPFTVVVMALMLSEIMVSAGVSVTIREPINRITEIASWLAVTWLLLRVIDAIFTRAVNLSYRKNYTERVSILGLLRKIVKALLLIFAVIVIFGNLGFDLTTGIAALGVGGLALALGAQKTIENLVGSVVVVADSPVRIGDYCKFGDQEGTVIDIGIRSSRVRTLSRTVVTVPNGDFSSMQIENFASRDMFQFLHMLYIKRSADIDEVFKMVGALDKLLKEHELTNQEWNQANILELRQDCYVIQLRAYVNSIDVIEFYGKQDTLLVDILNKVKKYKVEHALPTQQLIVEQGKADDAKENNDQDEALDAIDEASDATEHSDDAPTESPENASASTLEGEPQPKAVKAVRRKTHRKKSRNYTLAKRKFRRVTKNINLSIWNQP